MIKNLTRAIVGAAALSLLTGLSAAPDKKEPIATIKKAPLTQKVPLLQTEIISAKPIGKHPKFGEIKLGGLSGLFFAKGESTDKKLVFYTLTDRGPNAKVKDFDGDGHKDRPFILTDFAPEIIKLETDLTTNQTKVIKQIKIKKPDGKLTSGIPNVDRKKFAVNFDETPVTIEGKSLAFDPWGIDPESIAVAADGTFWIGEEYGPSILNIDKDGKILGRWSPPSEPVTTQSKVLKNKIAEAKPKTMRAGNLTLPKEFGLRKLNAGFEGLTLSGSKLFAFLQRPLPTKPKTKYVRLLEFDTEKLSTTGVFFYPLDPQSEKIGGATTLDDGSVAVLEHSGETGLKAYQKIYKIDFKGASNILSQSSFVEGNQKLLAGSTPVGKTLLFDLIKENIFISEKPEGIASLPGQRMALVNDNDFNLANIFDKKAAKEDQEKSLFIIVGPSLK